MTSIPPLPCLCASVRRASRALTQLYEEALRPTGIRGPQFTVLQALSLAGQVSQGKLGEILAMDSTTLTRTLGILVRRGWVSRTHGSDRREWRLGLTRKGKSQLNRAMVEWEKVQQAVEKRLGGKRLLELFRVADEITAIAQNQGGLL